MRGCVPRIHGFFKLWMAGSRMLRANRKLPAKPAGPAMTGWRDFGLYFPAATMAAMAAAADLASGGSAREVSTIGTLAPMTMPAAVALMK